MARRKKGRVKGRTYSPMPIDLRYLSYFLDLALLAMITTGVVALVGVPPVLYLIAVSSNLSVDVLWRVLTSTDGLFTWLVFQLIALGYFFAEALSGYSLGKVFMRGRVAHLETDAPIVASLIRGGLKAFPLLLLASRWVDRRLGFVPIQLAPPTLKHHVGAAAFLYYASFLTILAHLSYSGGSVGGLTPPPQSTVELDFSFDQVWTILAINFGVDYSRYFLGGMVLLLLTGLTLFGQVWFFAVFLTDSLASYPAFVSFGILPHFPLETMGYVIGIAGGMFLTRAVIVTVDSVIRGRSFDRTWSKVFNLARLAILSMILSSVILFLGALTEIYLTGYMLDHFYFQ